MKKTSILFLIFLGYFNMNAQDTISLKSGEIINATITERSNCKIKYQHVQNEKADTTLSLRLSKVKTIHFGNGSTERLSKQNPRSIFPLGVNGGADFFLFRLLFNASIDYLITPNISAEINYRSMLTDSYPAFSLFSIGGKYWFANKYSKSGFSPFVGLFFTQWKSKNDEDDILWHNEPVWKINYSPVVPIGITYISKSGFQTSFQLDNFFSFNAGNFYVAPLIAEVRVGWRFETAT
jgi:hypothetical protein